MDRRAANGRIGLRPSDAVGHPGQVRSDPGLVRVGSRHVAEVAGRAQLRRYGWKMPPLPRVTGRELVRALESLGWVLVVQKGSHAQLKHPHQSGRVTIPLHAGETIGPRLLRAILRQADVTDDDLRAQL